MNIFHGLHSKEAYSELFTLILDELAKGKLKGKLAYVVYFSYLVQTNN